MADKFWIDLSAECAHCGKVYGLHGAHDQQCPGELIAGQWTVPKTHFKAVPKQSPTGRDSHG